jgi:hypothetical protein
MVKYIFWGIYTILPSPLSTAYIAFVLQAITTLKTWIGGVVPFIFVFAYKREE